MTNFGLFATVALVMVTIAGCGAPESHTPILGG
jgi:hypothetical protein